MNTEKGKQLQELAERYLKFSEDICREIHVPEMQEHSPLERKYEILAYAYWCSAKQILAILELPVPKFSRAFPCRMGGGGIDELIPDNPSHGQRGILLDTDNPGLEEFIPFVGTCECPPAR